MSTVRLDADQWVFKEGLRRLDPKPPQVLGWNNVDEWLVFLEGVIDDNA